MQYRIDEALYELEYVDHPDFSRRSRECDAELFNEY